MRHLCTTWLILGLSVVCFMQHVQSAYDRQAREHRRRARHGRNHRDNTNEVTMTTTEIPSVQLSINNTATGQQFVDPEYQHVHGTNHNIQLTNSNTETSPSPTDDVTTRAPRLTQDMHTARVRARELQKFRIQMSIMHLLGKNVYTNETQRPLTIEDSMTIDIYRSNRTDPRDVKHAHMYRFASPVCDLPPKTHATWRDKDYFRLYFEPKEPENVMINFKLSSAVLRLYKKKHTECNCPHIPDANNKTGRSKDRESKQRRRSVGSSRSWRAANSQKVGSNARERPRRKALKKKNSSKRRRIGWTERKSEEAKRQLRVTISSYQKPLKKNRKVRKHTEVSQMVAEDHAGWVEINIRSLVDRWINRPRKNFGIEIEVEDDSNNPKDSFSIFEYQDCAKENQQEVVYINLTNFNEAQLLNSTQRDSIRNLSVPNVQMIFTETPIKVDRRKRDVSETCIMEKTYISFQEIKLNHYILAPQGVETAYCMGHCLPFLQDKNYNLTNHLDSNENAPKACCGPTKYKPFRYLHYSDSKTLTLSTVDNFIVAECGCRM